MKKILAANWKMHKTKSDVSVFFKAIGTGLKSSPVTKIIATSPTLMECAVKESSASGISIFSQNCAWAESGAFTGEISPLQLKELGVAGTLVGHSERRQFFGESNPSCAKRCASALAHQLSVIFCLGESLQERQSGQTRAVLESQLKPIFELSPSGAEHQGLPLFMLAYEPVWAIGTGVVASTAQVAEAHKWLAEMLAAAKLPPYPILYGGSVKPSNFQELSSVLFVNGGLVGGASLEAESFAQLHNCLKPI